MKTRIGKDTASKWNFTEEVKKRRSKTQNNQWQLQEAKAMFSEVIKSAQKEPQIITVHGEKTAVILSYDEYNKRAIQKMSLFEFFQSSPFKDIELELPPRSIDKPRDINL